MRLDDDVPCSPLTAAPENPAGSGPPILAEPTPAVKIQQLLDQIRSLDKSMDEARIKKIADIKKALTEGTYHVSAAEVARKIIDYMQEP